MSTVTPKLGLLKPAGSDLINVTTQLDDNYDKIDNNAGTFVCTSSTRPSGGSRFTGQLIFETDTNLVWVWNGSAWIPPLFNGAWNAYVPVWRSSGTAPAIGNGSLTGRFMQVGKTVFFSIHFVAGSTTTFGTGNYTVTLPVAAVALSARVGVYGNLTDISATTSYIAFLYWTNGTTANLVTNGSGGAHATVTNIAPFTWANTDEWAYQGCYEAA